MNIAAPMPPYPPVEKWPALGPDAHEVRRDRVAEVRPHRGAQPLDELVVGQRADQFGLLGAQPCGLLLGEPAVEHLEHRLPLGGVGGEHARQRIGLCLAGDIVGEDLRLAAELGREHYANEPVPPGPVGEAVASFALDSPPALQANSRKPRPLSEAMRCAASCVTRRLNVVPSRRLRQLGARRSTTPCVPRALVHAPAIAASVTEHG